MKEQINQNKIAKSSVGGSKLDQQTIQGILTSRIETRRDKVSTETYHYGFFKFPNQQQEIPIIFKTKPTIPKGSEALLTGNWANSNNSRPSFTCQDYQIINEGPTTMPNIYQKLQAIQAKTGQISKTELNKYQNYRYFTEQQALNILKPLLTEQRLTLTFSDNTNNFTQQKTEKEWVISYSKQATLTNSENPEEQLTFHYWAIGSNTDPAKAKGCAETYAIKYFLTKFFLIPTTDELDPDVTKSHEHLNRLANGKQETIEEIRQRHEDREHKKIAEIQLSK